MNIGELGSLAFLFVPAIGLFLAALYTGSRWLFVLPVLGWPLFFAGLRWNWWGYSTSDPTGWPIAAAVSVLFGAGGVWLGLLVHRSRMESTT